MEATRTTLWRATSRSGPPGRRRPAHKPGHARHAVDVLTRRSPARHCPQRPGPWLPPHRVLSPRQPPPLAADTDRATRAASHRGATMGYRCPAHDLGHARHAMAGRCGRPPPRRWTQRPGQWLPPRRVSPPHQPPWVAADTARATRAAPQRGATAGRHRPVAVPPTARATRVMPTCADLWLATTRRATAGRPIGPLRRRQAQWRILSGHDCAAAPLATPPGSGRQRPRRQRQ
jgi:hypothetical protein